MIRDILGGRRLEARFVIPILIVGFIVLGFILSTFAQLLTDYWWFDSLGASSVWSTLLQTKIFLVAIFALLGAGLVWINLYFVDRFAPESLAIIRGEDYLVERYNEIIRPRQGLFRLVFAGLIGLLGSSSAAGQWQNWLLYRNGGSWGRVDPVFDKDVSFYVFKLPIYAFLVDWFFMILILALLLSLGSYFLNGSLNPAFRKLGSKSTFNIKVHVSILLAAIALTRAIGYYLNRFELLYSDYGGFRGIMSTDSVVRMPALLLLSIISLAAVVLLIINIRRQGWGFAVIAVAIWGVSHILMLGIVPAIYQRLRVDPVRSVKEAEFVEANIEATRYGYALDNIDERSINYEAGLSEANAKSAEGVLSQIPLVDPTRADDEFNNNQSTRGFYGFTSPLDVGRYEIDGKSVPVVLSTRNLTTNSQDWEDRHVLKTHGYGVVIAAANDDPQVTDEGEISHPLDYQINGLGEQETVVDKDFPVDYSKRPQTYYGVSQSDYAIVGASRDEIDYQSKANESVNTRYEGNGGVSMGSLLPKVAFALRFGEIDPLISGSITSESKVLFRRNIKTRAEALAPFLNYDSDPYPVVVDGKVFFILDAYTTTDRYPYSTASANVSGGQIGSEYNYIRNSVKVVLDAYDGTLEFYVFDDKDPLISAWQKAFPDLFKPSSDMPDDLLKHIRYPKDIFRAQTNIWSSYVIDDPQVFIQGDTAWSVVKEPSSAPLVDDETTDKSTNSAPMRPQYLFSQLPSKDGTSVGESEYVLQRLFAPKDSNNRAKHLTAIMVARSDPQNYGQLVQIKVPSGEVQTPDIADTEIRKLSSVTELRKDRLGNKLDFGPMNLVLAGNNVVYVRSVYAESSGDGNIPERVRTVVATGDNKRAMAESLDSAIAGVVTSSTRTTENVEVPELDQQEPVEQVPPTDTEEPVPDVSDSPKSVTEAINLAQSLFNQADQAEADGNDELAAELRRKGSKALDDAEVLLGG